MKFFGGSYPGGSNTSPKPIAAMINPPGVGPISISASVKHLGQASSYFMVDSGLFDHLRTSHVLTFRLTRVDIRRLYTTLRPMWGQPTLFLCCNAG